MKESQHAGQCLLVQDVDFVAGNLDKAAVDKFVDLFGQCRARHAEVFGKLYLVMLHFDNVRTVFQVVEQIINVTAADAPERKDAKARHRATVTTGADAKEIVQELRHAVHQCKKIGFSHTYEGDFFFDDKGSGKLVLLGEDMRSGKGAGCLDDFDTDNIARHVRHVHIELSFQQDVQGVAGSSLPYDRHPLRVMVDRVFELVEQFFLHLQGKTPEERNFKYIVNVHIFCV